MGLTREKKTEKLFWCKTTLLLIKTSRARQSNFKQFNTYRLFSSSMYNLHTLQTHLFLTPFFDTSIIFFVA